MKIYLKTIAVEDGWGYIKKGKKYFLLRPPYPPYRDEIEVAESEIEKSLLHGFTRRNKDFERADEVVNYLKEEYLNSKDTIKVPTIEELLKLLKWADADTLSKYLKFAKKKLIEQKRFSEAKAIAENALKSKNIQSHPKLKLKNIAEDILTQCTIEKVIQSRKSILPIMDEKELNKELPWKPLPSTPTKAT